MLGILLQMMEPRYGGGGAIAGVLILWFLIAVGGIVAWVLFLVAAWRTMKAHESIAHSLYRAAKAHESMAAGAYRTAPNPGQPPPQQAPQAGPSQFA